MFSDPRCLARSRGRQDPEPGCRAENRGPPDPIQGVVPKTEAGEIPIHGVLPKIRARKISIQGVVPKTEARAFGSTVSRREPSQAGKSAPCPAENRARWAGPAPCPAENRARPRHCGRGRAFPILSGNSIDKNLE
jgi:hypothetical protein